MLLSAGGDVGIQTTLFAGSRIGGAPVAASALSTAGKSGVGHAFSSMESRCAISLRSIAQRHLGATNQCNHATRNPTDLLGALNALQRAPPVPVKMTSFI